MSSDSFKFLAKDIFLALANDFLAAFWAAVRGGFSTTAAANALVLFLVTLTTVSSSLFGLATASSKASTRFLTDSF